MARQTKYIGGWAVNNSGVYTEGYESNNKYKLARKIKNVCKGNVFAGENGSWNILATDTGKVVLSGRVYN